MVGDVEAGLQPDPLLALGEEAVVARGALSLLHEGLVAVYHAIQVVHVIILVARGAQKLKGQVPKE